MGGTEVIVEGTGFVDGTSVKFGSNDAIEAVVIDSTRATVTTPRLPRADYAVTVANRNGSATLAGAFSSWDPVRVTGVVPFASPLAGGADIVVRGTGFISPTEISLGGQLLSGTSNQKRRRWLPLPSRWFRPRRAPWM